MSEHCFISYSTADGLNFARRLADELEGGDDQFMDVWFDKRDIDPARDWDDQIVAGIRSCKCMAFVMTADSTAPGSMCKNEWMWALKYKKLLIPLRLDPNVEMPFALGSRQWIDFTGEFEHGLAKLRKFLREMDSPKGILHALEDRLTDANRDLQRANEEIKPRIQADIDDLKNQIKTQAEIVKNPAAAEEQTEKNIRAGLERERQPEKPSAVKSSTKFIYPPPGIAPNYFQDREVETGEVAKFLQDDAQRMMTLVGRGGVGKTAMICRLLKSLESGTLPDGLGEMKIGGIVYLSEMGSHRVNFANIFADLSRLLPDDAAEKLAVRYKDPQASAESKMNALLAHFQEARVLLLLDNFEPVVDPETQAITDTELDEALRALLCGDHHQVNALITTRLAPRDLNLCEPGRQRVMTLDAGLEPPYAENILREMDEDGKLGLKARAENDPLLQRARQKTRGYPRALEAFFAILAADRYTSLEELLEMPLPENVVEALVGEAFNRLSAKAQKIMQALAIYNRPVTPAAVDYLLQPHIPEINSAPILGRLANMHFARYEAGRFYLHPVDKEYALGKIPADSPFLPGEGLGERSAFTQHDLTHRAADYFAQARKPRAEWKKLDDLNAQLAEFDLRCTAGDYDTAASVLTEIDFDYLLLWGHYHLTIDLHEKLQGNIKDLTLARISVGNLGQALSYTGKVRQAISNYEKALDMAKEAKSRQAEGVWLGNLGLAYADLGEARKAITYHEEALVIAREIGDRRGKGADLGNLGGAYAALGEARKAITYHEEALVIAREIGDRRGEGADLGNLGNAYAELGEARKAITFYEDALAISREIGDRRGEGTHLGNLGNRYLDLGEYRKAIEYYEQSITIRREIGDQSGEATDLTNTAEALIGIEEYQKAKEPYILAIQIADNISSVNLQNYARWGLAQAYLFQNDLVNARTTIEDAFQYDMPKNNHNVSILHGIIALRQNDTESAQAAFTQAIAQADKILAKTPDLYDALDARGLALCGLALCAEDRGRKTEDRAAALETFRAARKIASHAGVVKATLRLFDQLAVCDHAGVLAGVRQAVGGG